VVIAGFPLLAVQPARTCGGRSLLPAAHARAVTTPLFTRGYRLATAATAIVLQYTAPL
jgi:hypothetical protein